MLAKPGLSPSAILTNLPQPPEKVYCWLFQDGTTVAIPLHLLSLWLHVSEYCFPMSYCVIHSLVGAFGLWPFLCISMLCYDEV